MSKNYLCPGTYEICPEGIQPCDMKNRDIYWRRYKIQETLYIGQWHLSPLQSRHLGTSRSSLSLHQLSSHIFLNLINCLKIISLSKVILVLGKARRGRTPNPGCNDAESPGWFNVSQKISAGCDAWVGALSWWSCQSPVAHSCSFHCIAFLNWQRTLC